MNANEIWEATEQVGKRNETGSLWLKLPNDGDRVTVVFLGAPYAREVCFVDNRYVKFSEELKAKGYKSVFRFAIDVAIYGTKEVKVLEQGFTFFKDLKEARAKYSLESWAFELVRHGSSKDSRTRLTILPDRQLTAEERAQFAALQLHDLANIYRDSTEDSIVFGTYSRPQEFTIPTISQADAQSLAAALKALPRAAIDRFCREFRVSRLKELPADRLEVARTFIRALTSELGSPPPTAEAADLFAM